jgi:hypothetical protein
MDIDLQSLSLYTFLESLFLPRDYHGPDFQALGLKPRTGSTWPSQVVELPDGDANPNMAIKYDKHIYSYVYIYIYIISYIVGLSLVRPEWKYC